MRNFLIFCFVLVLFTGCKKDQKSFGEGPKVEIYLLSSFNFEINQSTYPATTVIKNPVLSDQPFVADQDIEYYSKNDFSFKLKRDIKPVIKNYGSDKAFAVTVDKQPVYFGKFHPAYLSSITFGVATIDPLFFISNDLKINFATLTGSAALLPLDKRNDAELIKALEKTGRVR